MNTISQRIAVGSLGVTLGSILALASVANAQPPRLISQNSPAEPSGEPTAEPTSDEVPDETTAEPQESEIIAAEERFRCNIVNGEYTVTYHPESQPGQMYAWAVPRTLGGGWTAQRRCAEISRRLEFYRPDGLVELQTGFENNYETICVTTESRPDCRIVFTVPPEQNAIATRNQVFANLTLADQGQQTAGVATFAEGNPAIPGSILSDRVGQDIIGQIEGVLGTSLEGSRGQPPTSTTGIFLKPFLDPTDGGTGQYLNGGHSPNSGSGHLNPDNFR